MHREIKFIYALLLCVVNYALAEEPVCGCSQSHSSEQLLEKLVRIEVKLEQLEKTHTNAGRDSCCSARCKIEKLEKENKDLTNCTSPWITFEKSCYLFFGTRLNYFAADAECAKYQGHLAHIAHAAENDFIKSQLRGMKGDRWWIGVTDLEVEGTWKYFHNGPLATFLDFYNNEPSNALGVEHCVDIKSDYNYQWNDAPCNEINHAVCERALD